jgi:hypothetical protein
MAVNFRLFHKKTNVAVSLVQVDNNICRDVLDCTPHEKWWGGEVFNWYDTIGFQLAYGMTLEDGEGSVRDYYKDSDLWKEEYPMIDKVISYLQEHYTCNSWVSVYGR